MRPFIKGRQAFQKTAGAAFQVAKEVLFAKVIEQRARAAEAQRHFKPDLTIVLQYDASPASVRDGLAKVEHILSAELIRLKS
jgi:hypothetical protein